MCKRSKKNILAQEKVEIENKLHGIQNALDKLAFKKKALEEHLPGKAIFPVICAVNAVILLLIVRHFIHSAYGYKMDTLYALSTFVGVFSVCTVYRKIVLSRIRRTGRKFDKYLKEKDSLLDRVVEDLPVNAAVRLLTTYDSQDSVRLQGLVTIDPRLVAQLEQFQVQKDELTTALGVAVSIVYAIAPGGYTQAYNALRPIEHLLQKYHKEIDLSRRVPSNTLLSVMSKLEKGAESILHYITLDESKQFHQAGRDATYRAVDESPRVHETLPGYDAEVQRLVAEGPTESPYIESPQTSPEVRQLIELDEESRDSDTGLGAERTPLPLETNLSRVEEDETHMKESKEPIGAVETEAPKQSSSEDREEVPYFDEAKESKGGAHDDAKDGKASKHSLKAPASIDGTILTKTIDGPSKADQDLATVETPEKGGIDQGTSSVIRATPVSSNARRRKKK